jgi:hypothetical protein
VLFWATSVFKSWFPIVVCQGVVCGCFGGC